MKQSQADNLILEFTFYVTMGLVTLDGIFPVARLNPRIISGFKHTLKPNKAGKTPSVRSMKNI